MDQISFHQVDNSEERNQAGELIGEYLTWLNEIVQRKYGLEFEIDAMLQSDLTHSTKFSPPQGRFYLTRFEGQAAGVGCLKNIGDQTGEIQRMYVLTEFRRLGIGRAIVERLIEDARTIGYRWLRLESLEFLDAAHSLYRSVGFEAIDPYADNSMRSYQASETLDRYHQITVFMQLEL